MRFTFTAAAVSLTAAVGVLSALRPGVAIGAICGLCLFFAWRAQRQRFRRLPWDSESASVLCWQLIAFPTVLAMRFFSFRLALIGMTILAGSILLRRARHKLGERGLRWSLLVGVALLPPILRAEASWGMALSILAALFVFRAALVTEAGTMVSSLVYGVGVYLIANVVLFYGVGLTSATSAVRLSGHIGTGSAERAFFPLTASVNLPPNMAAVYVVGALPLLVATGSARRRLALVAGMAAAVAVLLGGSSRTSLLTVAAVVIAAFFVPRLLRGAAPVAVAVAGVSGFIYAWIAGAVGSALAFLASFVPYLDRGASSVSTYSRLDGRHDIWANVLRAWVDAPLVEKVFGYGSEGQVASGASLTYSYLFRGWLDNPYRGTAHNSTLQMLLDAGLVGVILFLGLSIVAVTRWSRLSGSVGLAGTSMLIVLALASLTEIATASGFGQETFWVFACLVMAASFASQPTEHAPPERPNARQAARPVGALGVGRAR